MLCNKYASSSSRMRVYHFSGRHGCQSGGSLPGGGVVSVQRRDPSHVDRITKTSENITFPQLRWRAGNNHG